MSLIVSSIFNLLPIWWYCLDKFRKCDFAGERMSLGGAVFKSHALFPVHSVSCWWLESQALSCSCCHTWCLVPHYLTLIPPEPQPNEPFFYNFPCSWCFITIVEKNNPTKLSETIWQNKLSLLVNCSTRHFFLSSKNISKIATFPEISFSAP